MPTKETKFLGQIFMGTGKRWRGENKDLEVYQLSGACFTTLFWVIFAFHWLSAILQLYKLKKTDNASNLIHKYTNEAHLEYAIV